MARRDRGPAERGATAVEFAFIGSLFLLLVFGVIDMSRLVASQAGVTSAGREAARYGSAVGTTAGGHPRFVDCDGIRRAGKRVAHVTALTDSDFTVTYDDGPGTAVKGTCPAGTTANPDLIESGDRVVIRVQKSFRVTTPLLALFLDGITLSAEHRRTINR